MKCSKCSFVVSNKKDVCPRCHFDLRPRKAELGLIIYNTEASAKELVEMLAGGTAALPVKQETAPIEEELKPAIVESDLALPEIEPEPVSANAELQMSTTSAASGGLQEVIPSTTAQTPVFSFEDTATEEEAPEEEKIDLKEVDPITSISESLQDHLDDAKNATESLSVTEFSEDDEELEQELDSILGDLEVKVEAVQTDEKPVVPPTTDAVTFEEDDFEISFEVELEDGESNEVSSSDFSDADNATISNTDDDLFDGLLDALSELEEQSEHKKIAEAELEGADSGSDTEVLETKLMQSYLEFSKEKRPASGQVLSGGSYGLPAELETKTSSEQNSDTAAPETDEAVTEQLVFENQDMLDALGDELDQELGELLSEGTSFLATANSESSTEDAAAFEIASLEQELAQELEALAEEGGSFGDEEPLGDVGNGALPLAVNTGMFLEEDLQRALEEFSSNEEVEEGEVAESIEEELSFDESFAEERFSEPALSELWGPGPWSEAQTELANCSNGEHELAVSVLNPVKPSERTDVLFDVVMEQLQDPDEAKEFQEVVNTASIDNSELDGALAEYKLENALNATKALKLNSTGKLESAGETSAEEAADESDLSYEAALEAMPPIPLAARWRRAFGTLVDVTITFVASLAFAYATFLPEHIKAELLQFQMPDLVSCLPYLAQFIAVNMLCWCLIVFSFTAGNGQTPGQGLFGIVVRDLNGEAVDVSQALLRTICQLTTIITFGLGAVSIVGAGRRTLQDYLAGTVVAEREEEAIELVIPSAEREKTYVIDEN